MTRKEAVLWECLCSKQVPYETEICPGCGRHKDFVLGANGGERRLEGDHPGSGSVEAPARSGRPAFPPGRAAGWARRLRGFSWEEYRRPIRWAVNIAILMALYWVTMSVTEYLRQPKLQMLQSPIAGPLAVEVEAVKPRRIAAVVTYTGTVSPIQEVTVYPRVQGWLQDFNLYEGDAVKKGQVIARLDRDELRAAVAQAQERVAAGEQHRAEAAASLGIHKAGILEAEAALQEAEANLTYWGRELKRAEALFKGAAIAESELDNARRQLAAAAARRDAQRAKIESLKARLQAAQRELARIDGMLKARRAELAQRSTVLGYTDIVAPISGRVAKRYVYSGVLLKPGASIVEIADARKVRVQVHVAEKDLPRLKVGTPAVVRVPALPEPVSRFETKVSTIFPKLDPATRTNTVEMIVENPERLLQPDMFVVADLVLEAREKAWTVPRRDVIEVEGKPTVFVAEGTEAVARPVKLGLAGGERVEILEGIKAGDLVVIEGNRSLVDGQEIAVVSRR